MGEEERRCESMYSKAIGDPWVRCDRWGGHAGKHRGSDVQDMVYRWLDEEVEDRRLGQQNHIPEEMLKPFETNQVQELEKLVQQWKDRCLTAERARDEHWDSLQLAKRQRDIEARNAMTLIRKLQELEQAAREMKQEPCEALRECERYANMVVGERDEAIRQLGEASDKLHAIRELTSGSVIIGNKLADA